jgi:hypothetical protein
MGGDRLVGDQWGNHRTGGKEGQSDRVGAFTQRKGRLGMFFTYHLDIRSCSDSLLYGNQTMSKVWTG